MRMRRASQFVVFLCLCEAVAAHADAWSALSSIDARTPLEVGRAAWVESDAELYAPVAFAGELELVVVDLTDPAQPVPRTVNVWPAAVQSLGSAGYSGPSNRLGGAFVDAATSDLRFWSCSPPCQTVDVALVDGVRNWADADSDVAGHDFVAGGVDVANGDYLAFDTVDGGASFDVFRQIASAGVLRTAQGGERARLVVDPQSTDASDAFHCVFLERSAGGQATEKLLDCAWGSMPAFTAPMASDVANPGGQVDRFVENACVALPFDPGVVACVFDRRADASVRAVIVDSAGGLARDRVLGAMPPGTATPRYAALQANAFDTVLNKVELVSGGGPSRAASNWTWAPGSAPPDSLRGSALPTVSPGPLGVGLGRTCDAPLSCRLFLAALVGDAGLRLTVKPMPYFDDGFETGGGSRWSVVQP